MYDKLTQVDIQKMQEEIDELTRVTRPKCVEDLKTAREFGDLSENYEYKVAKQALRRCDSRLRHLKRMIETAHVVTINYKTDRIDLFDTIELYSEARKADMTVRMMTTLRRDVGKGIISNESPLGRALMGHRVGDRVYVKLSEDNGYYVQIKAVHKGDDDASLPITKY